MMKPRNPLKPLKILLVIVTAIFLAPACNKKFDEPPAFTPAEITPDLTIADLKAMHRTGSFEVITIDKTIGGIVIADDESGQFYKTIVIQDETGGISINLDGYDLYTSYPIGRKVYVKVKDLYLGDFNRMIQLGAGVDYSSSARLSPIPAALFNQYLIKGTLGNSVEPKAVSVADLNESLQNTLIQLNDFEFAVADTSKTFADASLGASAINYTIKSCSGESIILRNSSYADFAGYNLPNGNGSITAVYSVFGSTRQLNIRDTGDVQFYNQRCNGTITGNGTMVSIDSIRNLYPGFNVKLEGFQMKGTVISDAGSKNIATGKVILQDGNKGIAVSFSTAVSYNIGDSVLLDLTGDSLLNNNGSLEIKAPAGAVKPAPVATNRAVAPMEITIKQLTDDFKNYEYVLLKIKEATASGSSTYAGNNTLTDATGAITLFTSSSASFAAASLPSDARTWTGFCNTYGTTKEFQLRNLGDVEAATSGGGSGTGDLFISEYVEGSSYNKYLELYNGSSSMIDLTKYTVKLYLNGSSSAGNSVKLDVVSGSGTLEAGGIIVLKYTSAALELPVGVIAYPTSACNFNGDDAITLEKDGIVIDVFGEVGVDPGNSWSIAGSGSAAVDKTVRRISSITQGNANWSISSASEWIVITATDDVSNLGAR